MIFIHHCIKNQLIMSQDNNKNIIKKDIGLMKPGSVFGCRTFFGYKLDIVKSGIQKYLRRRELDKMIWNVVEMDLFSRLDDKNVKGIRSNLMNRIIVMFDEEMCFCDWSSFLKCSRLLEKWNNEGRNDSKKLILICKILVKSDMLRLASDVNGYYRKGVKCEFEKGSVNISKYVKQKDSSEIVKLFSRFVELFEERNEDFFYYSQEIYSKKENSAIRKFFGKGKRGSEYIIWEYLFDKCGDNKYLKECLKRRLEAFYVRNRKERHIFLINSLLLVYNKEKLDWNPEKMKIKEEVSDEEVCKYYNERKKLFYDDYVVDMHTSVGRKKGKSYKEFALEGSVVVNENKEWFVKKYRDNYINNKLNMKKKVKKGKKKKKVKKDVKKNVREDAMKFIKNKIVELVIMEKEDVNKAKENVININAVKCNIHKELREKLKKREVKNKSKIRMEKYKRIKKMRGSPEFDDLENGLEVVEGIDESKIKICTENTCGNKVMCFEYEGKIWKEGRKSMNYNRDYCVLDECKEVFGLEKIGMKRVLSNFRIEKVDKTKKSWVNNWHKVDIRDGYEKIVYCVMDKITPGIEIGKVKVMLKDRKILKEYVKIGVFRGIFRVSDFNGRNVLVKDENKLVSIDEGDIGKRLDILGGKGKHKWLVKMLNKDKKIINEILNELDGHLKKEIVVKKMVEYKFNDEMCNEILNNWKNLYSDLKSEGVEFE